MDFRYYERVLKDLRPFKSIFLFLFRPNAFKGLAIDHDTANDVVGEPDIRKLFLEGKYQPNIKHTTELVEFRTNGLRKSLFYSAVAVVGAGLFFAVIGFFLSRLYGTCPAWLGSLLQMLGVGIILWATLWELGWHFRSIDGKTLTERVHLWLFRALYTTGSALFFLAYSWATQW